MIEVEIIPPLLFALGFLGFSAMCYWGWFAFVCPFVGPKLGWVSAAPRFGADWIGVAGGCAFLACVVFLPVCTG